MSYRATDGRQVVETPEGPVTMCEPGQSLEVRHGPSWSSDNPGWASAIEAAVEVDDGFRDGVQVGSTVQLLSQDGSAIIGMVFVLATASGGYLWSSTYRCFETPSVG